MNPLCVRCLTDQHKTEQLRPAVTYLNGDALCATCAVESTNDGRLTTGAMAVLRKLKEAAAANKDSSHEVGNIYRELEHNAF